MKLKLQTPKQALDKAFLKQRPLRSEINLFKTNLIRLLGKIDEIEREENQKNHIRDFLRDTFYQDKFELNTKDSKDLVIHLGKTNKDKVGVIFEAKRPSNKAEMLSVSKPNTLSLQEIILYYFDERVKHENSELKKLVITNVYEWYIFDANTFDKVIYRDTKLKKLYETYRNDKKGTLFFYEEASKLIDKIDEEVTCAYFDLRSYKDPLSKADKEADKDLIALQKIISPQHLLKLPFSNDSNELDQNFYKELLHIIGLEEVQNTIVQKKKPCPASLIEMAIKKLRTKGVHKVPDLISFGETPDEQYFNIALELCITWINRILFLKLLEGQLVRNHKGDEEYKFLYIEKVKDFDAMFDLFHNVLAVDIKKRDQEAKTKYKLVPYLNSSLFDISDLEDLTISIDSLDNSEVLEYIPSTVLKDPRKNKENLRTLEYLFKFLNAYDFSSEGSEDIQEDNRTLINASVLGKVFEKINGYKDGSVYTPGYITMYMSKQAVRAAVLQKFKEHKKEWKLKSFDDIYNKIEDTKEANAIINKLKICDPAVGSGHFLVSVLNEIIAIKSELKILQDKNNKRLKEYTVEVVNDELYITDEEGGIFEYKPRNKESQRVQETLFQEKQRIIENCLFGVDINPNSAKICRLRLWIELLKNAYYKESTSYEELETLPNIDINIKCGNSLLNKYSVKDNIFERVTNFKKKLKDYMFWVDQYKNATDRALKKQLKSNIKVFVDEFKKRDPKIVSLEAELGKKSSELYDKYVTQKLFTEEMSPALLKEKQKLEDKITELTKEIAERKQNDVYKNAFEWRLEFPEILSPEGKFEGFDLVIGNPPYGVSIKGWERQIIVDTYNKVPDFEIYYFFINLSKHLLKENGINCFIIPNTILFNVGAKKYRENLFSDWEVKEILDCTNFNIFEGAATVRCVIITLVNDGQSENVSYRPTANVDSFDDLIDKKTVKTTRDVLLANNQNWALVFKLSPEVTNLTSKIRQDKSPLIFHFPELSQGLIAYDKYQGQDQHTIENRVYHSTQKQNGWKKWLWGEDITPYSVKWNGKEFINYCDGIANPREPKYFTQERILVREITNPKIFAGYTNDESYNDPAIINILANKKGVFKIKTLLAILNSKLATFYHFNSSPKATKGAFPKILVEDIKTFPLPTISENQQQALTNLVDKVIDLKQNGSNTAKEELKIDELVYKLYNISPEEIQIIEKV